MIGLYLGLVTLYGQFTISVAQAMLIELVMLNIMSQVY